MGDGGANRRIDNVLKAELKALENVAEKIGADAYPKDVAGTNSQIHADGSTSYFSNGTLPTDTTYTGNAGSTYNPSAGVTGDAVSSNYGNLAGQNTYGSTYFNSPADQSGYQTQTTPGYDSQTYAGGPGSSPVAPIFFQGQGEPSTLDNGNTGANGVNGQQPWRAGWRQVAPGYNPTPSPETPPPFGQKGPYIPTSPSGSTVTSGGSYFGNGQQPWRAGWGQVAPGANPGGVPGSPETPPPFGQKPPYVPTSPSGSTATSGGNGLSDVVKQKAGYVESLLTRQEHYTSGDFFFNSMLGGVSGYLFGGPLARALDYGTKKYLVYSDNLSALASRARLAAGDAGVAGGAARAAGGSVGAFDRAAIWYQQHHGLTGNEDVVAPLFSRDRQLMTDIVGQSDALEPELARIAKELPDRALSADEKALLARYRALSGLELPAGVMPNLTAEDIALLEKHGQLTQSIQDIQSSLAGYSAVALQELTQKDALLEKQLTDKIAQLEPAGKPALAKLEVQGEAALTPEELTAARKYKFFTEFEKDATKAPKDYGLSLTAEESSLVAARQQVKGQIIEMEPHVAAQADLPSLKQELATVNQDLQAKIDAIKPQAQQLEEKLNASPETHLTADEKALMDRYNFLKGGGVGEVPAGVKLDPTEAKLVAERQTLSKKIQLLEPYYGKRLELQVQQEQIAGRLQQTVVDLKPQIDQIEARLKADPAAALTPEETLLRARYNFLKDGAKGAPPLADILTKEDAALLVQREQVNSQLAELAKTDITAARGWKASIKNFGKGVLAVEGAQLVDDRLDSWLFGSMKTKPSWYTDSLAVPAAMLLPGGWFRKGLYMVGAHVAGKMLDGIIPASSNPTWDRFMKPNNMEAISVAGAMLIPMRNESLPLRLGYMGAAWLGSHLLNYAFSGPDPKAIRDDAVKLFVADKSQRSASSMNSAIDKFNDLGKVSNAAVNFYLGDWLSRTHTDLLSGYRGAAVLLTSAGETSLNKGTFIPNAQAPTKGNPLTDITNVGAWGSDLWHAITGGSNNQQFSYLLDGKNYDLGGMALMDLVSAKIELDRSKTQTQQMAQQGQSDHGSKVQSSEIQGIDQVEIRVQDDLNKIYGEHDIDGIYDVLEPYTYNLNQEVMGKIRDQIKGVIASPGTNDKQYMAKFYRDLALIDLAFAGGKVNYRGVGKTSDGAGAAIVFREAQAALQQAQQLDPNNPDLPQLQKIAGDISKIVPSKVTSQGQSTINNPFGVTNWQPTGVQGN